MLSMHASLSICSLYYISCQLTDKEALLNSIIHKNINVINDLALDSSRQFVELNEYMKIIKNAKTYIENSYATAMADCEILVSLYKHLTLKDTEDIKNYERRLKHSKEAIKEKKMIYTLLKKMHDFVKLLKKNNLERIKKCIAALKDTKEQIKQSQTKNVEESIKAKT